MTNLNHKVFLWNCRGAASTGFYRACKNYIDNNRPDIFVIMETRVDPKKLEKTLNLLGFDKMVYENCRGFAGGILVAWKEDSVTVNLLKNDFQFLHLSVTLEDGLSWNFTTVYASPKDDLKRELWMKLHSISASIQGSWLVAGDFNDIASSAEKKGGARASIQRCNQFVNNINKCNLMDLGAVGAKFTWKGPIYEGRERIFERLDRALCNDDWRLNYPEAIVRVLPRIDFSDHHPIILYLHGMHNAHRAYKFRFERAWVMHPNYKYTIQKVWNDNNSMHVNIAKTEEELKHWRIHTFGCITKKKHEILARLGGIQRKQTEGSSNHFLDKLEKNLQREIHLILHQEELMWHQKSRAKWIQDGDRNTRYYHLKTIKRRKKNRIVMLRKEDGEWVDDEATLKNMVNSHYEDLFTDTGENSGW
jgi:exonuclease III